MKAMKVGLIVECAPQGLEAVVCPRILELLAAEVRRPIEPVVVPMINKKLLIRGAADSVTLLLKDGCERVVILWDDNPPWTPEEDIGDERCWHTEREQLITSLAAARVTREKVGLVCIEREFETWLLHDAPLLRELISRGPHRRPKVKPIKDPLLIDAPKRYLMRLFRKHGSVYSDPVVARKCRENLDGLDRLRDCDTFRYFVQMVLGRMPSGWKPYVYTRKGPRA